MPVSNPRAALVGPRVGIIKTILHPLGFQALIRIAPQQLPRLDMAIYSPDLTQTFSTANANIPVISMTLIRTSLQESVAKRLPVRLIRHLISSQIYANAILDIPKWASNVFLLAKLQN
jgi:hypothetical protein